MPQLQVIISDKIATYVERGGEIVCGNSDYTVKFSFDEEWAGVESKTARFVWNGEYYDVDFEGDVCAIPVITRASQVQVGVYAGELQTTTPALIKCRYSILCQSGVPSAGNDEGYCNEAKSAADRAEAAAASVEGHISQIDANTSMLENHSNDIEYLREKIEEIEIPEAESGLPKVTTNDNGKVLTVVGGKWEAKNAPSGSGGSGGVSSWDDLTDKPFGEENEVVFDGVFQDEIDSITGTWEGVGFIEDTTPATLKVGETYTVTWEGKKYECECKSTNGVPWIGNPTGVTEESGSEPFTIMRVAVEGLWVVRLFNPPTDLTVSGTYPFKIEYNGVKQLDNKYLAILDGVAGTEPELLNESTGVTEYNSSLGAFCFYPPTTEETVTYWNSLDEGTVFVEFDGEVYECSPQRIAAFANAVAVGNCAVIGGTGNNEPFVVAATDDEGPDGNRYYAFIVAGFADTQPTSHTVSIWQGTRESYKIKHEYPLEQPVSIDMSAFESEGKIVETYADGKRKVTTIEFNAMGNPSKITDSDGNVIQFMW